MTIATAAKAESSGRRRISYLWMLEIPSDALGGCNRCRWHRAFRFSSTLVFAGSPLCHAPFKPLFNRASGEKE